MKIRTVLIALVLVGVAGVAARAQERATGAREVALALVDTLSKPGLRAEILRFSDPNRRDVILLPRDATVDAVAAALMAYRESATAAPTRPGLIGRIGVTDLEIAGPHAAQARARAAELLAQVRRERPVNIGNYGRGRWTTIRVSVGG